MNAQDIIRETYDSALKAQKVSLVSAATIFVKTEVTINPTLGTNATYGTISLTSIGTLILPANTSRRSLIVRNIANTTVFIGNTSIVTTGTGLPLQKDDSLTLDNFDGNIYGVADATGHLIRFLAELD